MSIYDYRDSPAYSDSQIEPKYGRNKYILKWWTSAHDGLIAKQIEREEWLWYWKITDSVVANTQKEILDKWQKNDPLCSQYAWYNILMYFSMARAKYLGLTNQIRKPEWKKCLLCNKKFIESSLPYPLVQRFGVDRLHYCSPCLRDSVLQNSGDPKLSKQKTLIFLRDLAVILEKVPTQGFGEGVADFHSMDDEQRLAILKILQRKPSTNRVKEIFGSWLKALIEAGILEDGTWRTTRGIQTIARDGHVCLSLGEKTIDDYLFEQGISHEIEPHYPEGNYRADFLVGDIFIEYFGLKGNLQYDQKTKLKQKLCKKHGIRLISIYPEDLVSIKKLHRKMGPILSKNGYLR
ncbi:MAG: hypothetical protein DRH37_11575 [Deltaproteobacteria bacterium]|nr:MAG: hypothetical protein DRH37_11575 [Deltaproteobacteria bacterium]